MLCLLSLTILAFLETWIKLTESISSLEMKNPTMNMLTAAKKNKTPQSHPNTYGKAFNPDMIPIVRPELAGLGTSIYPVWLRLVVYVGSLSTYLSFQ